MNTDNLSQQLYVLQRMPERVALMHEAGHAVASFHYGLRVFAMDLDPLPYVLVNSLWLSKHQKGVLLAAGGAMTKVVYGFEWGGDASDYKMAAALGDLEEFKAEAEELVSQYLAEAKFLVEGRLGKLEDDPRLQEYGPSYVEWLGPNPEAALPDLSTDSPNYAAYKRVVEKAHLGRRGKALVAKAATFQVAHSPPGGSPVRGRHAHPERIL